MYEYMYPFITSLIGMTQIDSVCAKSGKTMTDANTDRSNAKLIVNFSQESDVTFLTTPF